MQLQQVYSMTTFINKVTVHKLCRSYSVANTNYSTYLNSTQQTRSISFIEITGVIISSFIAD